MKAMKKKMCRYAQKHNPRKNPVFRGVFLFSAACLWLSGCGAAPEPDDAAENMVVIDHDEDEIVYITMTVSVQDVFRTAKVFCRYTQAEGEESDITVSAIGRTVEDVYVQEGDSVTAGQLVALLSGGDHAAEIRDLEYQVERNKLLLGYTELDEAYDVSYRWWTYLNRSSMSEQDSDKLEQDLEDIHRSYRYLREDYQDAIDLNTAELALLREETEQCRIYADKTGEVSYVNPYAEGSVIKEKKSLLKIADRSQCYFEANKTDYMHCFQEGKTEKLIVTSGGNSIEFEVIPMDMEHWEDSMIFEVISGDSSDVPIGRMGHIPITVESKAQVLAVPNRYVHSTREGQYYVYVFNDNNVREIKWVETGLRGDTLTEIVSGLEEGEEIIQQ